MKGPQSTEERRHELDWLRVLAILAVFAYHASLIFALDPYQIKNAVTYEFLDDLGGFGGTWGMPLIFLISVASVYFTLGKVRAGTFVKGMILRLLVPLGVCIFTHAAWQVYLERLQTGRFRGSFLEFVPDYFRGMYGFGGNFAWMGMHLWYLEALFLFSLLCLPLFLWLRSHPAGHRVLQRAGDALARPGSLYLLALPPYILINVLDPETWGMDAIGGWSIFIYLTFFVSGFVIYSNARLQDRIRRARWVSLAGGIVLWAGIDPLWGALGDPNFATWQFALGTIPWCLNAWCWLLAILGFGMERLGFRTPFLAYANETTLPFYILHQTVLLTLAFPIVCWPIPDGVKFLTVLIGTFVTVMALYEFAVRRSNLLRILFGMKPLPRPAAERRRRLAEQAA